MKHFKKAMLMPWTGGGIPAPINSVLPVISGTAAPQQTLSTTDGTWSGSPTFTYQWKRNGAPIGGATANTYIVQNADVDTTTTVTVTATNGGGSTPATSTGVTFTPTQIANLLFGVDAGSLSATPVSSWVDLSTGGHNATQGTGSKQPIWSATAFNSAYPGVTFDGTDDFLRTAGFTLSQVFQVFMVCNLVTTSINKVMLDGVAAQAALYQGGGPGNAMVFAGSNGPVKAISTTPHVISAVWNNASSRIALDNGSASTGTAGTNNPGGVTIGADLTGASAANVCVAAVWFYSPAVSAGDETNLVRYLGAKYGITVA